MQVRPGHWALTVTAHHPGPVAELTLGDASPPWPPEEVWVFAAYPQLRQVEPTGAELVDPRQDPTASAMGAIAGLSDASGRDPATGPAATRRC